MNLYRACAIGALVLVAGCLTTETSATPSLTLRGGSEDSLVTATVDSISGNLQYKDIVVFVGDRSFRMGPRADLGQSWFEVKGKQKPTDPIEVGDEIRIPAAGRVEVQFRLVGSSESLFSFVRNVPDETAPPAPKNLRPENNLQRAPRDLQFAWEGVNDPSGVTYSLQYWIVLPGNVQGQVEEISGLTSTSWAPPSSKALSPGTTYAWHVRAWDGSGNGSPWSETWEFTTSVGP